MRLEILHPFVIVLRVQMHIVKGQLLRQVVVFILIDFLNVQVENVNPVRQLGDRIVFIPNVRIIKHRIGLVLFGLTPMIDCT